MDSTERWEFAVLGPLLVRRDDVPVEIPGRKARALLALLLLRANDALSRERLVDALWGDDVPESAANALQVHVHTLRKALGADRIATEGTGYRILVERDELDLHRFEDCLAAGRPHEALALWRGDPLAGLEEEPFARREIDRLVEARLEAVDARVATDLANGDVTGLAGELELLVAEHPYRESLHGLLMRVHYEAGRQSDALDAYTRARRVLRDDLGLEPGAALRDLQAMILRGEPPAASARRQPSSLPVPPTALVGRELERAAVAALLRRADVRLLTLTGPGGTGKTRLALSVAHLLEEEGVPAAFVDLAPLERAEQVPTAIAASLGLAESAAVEPLQALVEALRRRDLLLVLDNFEHLLEAAPSAAALLAAGPGVRILATSRAPLRVAAEHEYRVPPLSSNESAALFAERARAAGADVRDEVEGVRDLCARLDHLPLALELAAARLRLFSLPALRARLDRALDVLASGARDAPVRHRTLSATIDWSVALLSPRERDVFVRLAPFAGSFAVEDAEAVTGAALDELAALVDAGLVVRSADDRLRLLETVRQYASKAAETTGDASAQRLAHALHYRSVAERHAPSLRGPGAERALQALEHEYDNLRAALAAARDEGDVETLLRLARALDRYWYVRGLITEGLGWVDEALRRSEGRRTRERALALKSAALLAWRGGEDARAERLAHEARVLLEELGDEGELVGAFSILGAIEHSRGAFAAAQAHYEQAVDLAARTGRQFERTLVLNNLAGLVFAEGEIERSGELYLESIAEARALGATELAAFGLLGLIRVASHLGDNAGSAAYAAEALDLFARLGFRDRMATCCIYLADVTDDDVAAAQLLGASTALGSGTGAALDLYDQELLDAVAATLRRRLGADGFDAAFREGERDANGIVDAARAAGDLRSGR